MASKKSKHSANAQKASAPSQRALAVMLGVSPPAVCQWAARSDWPFGKRGPFDVAAVQLWRRNNLLRSPVHDIPIGPHDAEPLRLDHQGTGAVDASDANDTAVLGRDSDRLDLDNRLKRERTAKLRVEIGILRAKYIRRDTHTGAVVALLDQIQAKIGAFIENVPAEFAGLPTSKIRLLGRDWYDRFCRDMQSERSIEFPAPMEGGTT